MWVVPWALTALVWALASCGDGSCLIAHLFLQVRGWQAWLGQWMLHQEEAAPALMS